MDNSVVSVVFEEWYDPCYCRFRKSRPDGKVVYLYNHALHGDALSIIIHMTETRLYVNTPRFFRGFCLEINVVKIPLLYANTKAI